MSDKTVRVYHPFTNYNMKRDDGTIVGGSTGGYVKHEDYARLAERVEDVVKAAKNIRKKLMRLTIP